jgi:cytochrome c-type protein NapB
VNYRLPALLIACALCWACAGPVDIAEKRAARRSYDGAPPAIGHELFDIECTACHARQAVEIEGRGWSPAMPHNEGGAFTNCRQCHVVTTTDTLFQASLFQPLEQNLRSGRREHRGAPPVIPHKLFMRENCLACHDGPAAREAIRVTHPERERCLQCHVQQRVADEWLPATAAAE